MVVDESDRLDRIVGNLLSVSRIEAGALLPERSPCDIGEIVATCARRFERLSATAAHVEVSVEPGLPAVDVDTVQVDQVLTNLVENARRATATGLLDPVAGVATQRCLRWCDGR